MKIYGETKFATDGYAGGFSCGMTMCNSATMERFELVSEDERQVLYRNPEGVELCVQKTAVESGYRVKSTLTNRSGKAVTLEMLASFVVKNIEADKIHRLQSFWSAEGKLRTETILDLHMEPSWNHCAMRVEKFGNVGSMPVRKYFPFLALEDSKTGRVTGIQLYCASSWQMELLCKDDDSLTVAGGLADADFGQWTKQVKPGESFTTPEAVIVEGDSLYDVCDALVKAQNPDISDIDSDMGILFNEYCTTWGNPSFENVKRICDYIEGKGIKYLVIDSGWYGKSDGWWNSIGDWDVNEERFPGGMKPIADYIRSKGMIPGLWFEMESVAHASSHYEEAEHLLRKNGVPLTVGGRRFWDMQDAWVVDYLSKAVIDRLRNAGFGYLKVDYNDTVGIGCDDADGFGEGLRKKVQASRAFFRKIKRELPQLVIENCSSGGHRLEPSMMELVSQASFSDAHETTAIPLIAANMHRVIKPSQSQIWAVLRGTDTRQRIQYSIAATFLGRMCLSGDIYSLNEEQWKLVEEGMDFYRKAADIIAGGKTICQEYTTESYNHPTGYQLVLRKLENRTLAVLHRFEKSGEVSLDFLKGRQIEAVYGQADGDFTAQAWIYQ